MLTSLVHILKISPTIYLCSVQKNTSKRQDESAHLKQIKKKKKKQKTKQNITELNKLRKMFKYYLFLIIVMCVVQQRICIPLDIIHANEYNVSNEITNKAIDLNVPSADTEGVHLKRRYYCLEQEKKVKKRKKENNSNFLCESVYQASKKFFFVSLSHIVKEYFKGKSIRVYTEINKFNRNF